MRNIKPFSFETYKQTIQTDTAKKNNISSISKALLLEQLQKEEPLQVSKPANERQPIWKHAFALADNVRFTRTPDIEILRKKAEKDPAYANQLKAIYERQEKQPSLIAPQTIIKNEENNTPSIISKTPEIILVSNDAEITENIKASKSEKNIEEIVLKPEQQDIVQPIHETNKIKPQKSNPMFANKLNEIEAQIKIENTQADDTKLAMIGISDFAFFEFEPFHVEVEVNNNDMPQQQQNSSEIEKELPQQSITELFRVLECKFSKSGRMEATSSRQEVTKDKETIEDKRQSNAHNDLESSEKLSVNTNEQAKVTAIQNVNTSVNSVNNVDETENNTSTSLENLDNLIIADSTKSATAPHCINANDNIIDLDEQDYSHIIENSAKNSSQALSALTANKEVDFLDETTTTENQNTHKDEILSQITQAKNITITKKNEKEEIKNNNHPDFSDNSTLKTVAITPRHITDLQSDLRINKPFNDSNYMFPSVELLQPPIYKDGAIISQETLERSAGLLESVLEDFGIKGEIIHVRPGPVVTLYEFEPAPGVKSSRVIGLADDIARSMSAVSARVAVVPGRNVIGIELPNSVRETVFLREIIQSKSFETSDFKLALALGKNIGGEPVIAELAKMPHLLVAGTTGSGKSVAINTMILSLLYHLTPNQCRLIMVDPKMLELSIYDGIPHLLTPVVTDPKKAVTALKWAVREMEERYRKMAKLGVRNIDGFNERVNEAVKNGETIMCTVQAGFDKETGELLYNEEAMDLTALPYIVIIVDEMADLMMVAGKEIENAIQRLAQMARAAGIHLIMATQRPSVDVITGTIKANFPTRISFQVTSKIDSRTILGEQGAETLLGQGDMLHMAGGGRIVRVHGAFVSDSEVENIVSHLKTQGTPEYLAVVTDSQDDEQEDDSDMIMESAINAGDEFEILYAQAIKVVMRDKKCSTSYIQRRLGIGYNKAASLVERMEKEGLVGMANHVGKREILINNH